MAIGVFFSFVISMTFPLFSGCHFFCHIGIKNMGPIGKSKWSFFVASIMDGHLMCFAR